MCYNEYIEAGGTNASLAAALDEFFLGGENAIRKVICETNDERNQILEVLSGWSSLPFGFAIGNYTHMNWNCVYYDKTVGQIHSGRCCLEGEDADNVLVESIYLSLLSNLGDAAEEYVELPDIMTLFEPAC